MLGTRDNPDDAIVPSHATCRTLLVKPPESTNLPLSAIDLGAMMTSNHRDEVLVTIELTEEALGIFEETVLAGYPRERVGRLRGVADIVEAIAVAAPSLAIAAKIICGIPGARAGRTYIRPTGDGGWEVWIDREISDARVFTLGLDGQVHEIGVAPSAEDVEAALQRLPSSPAPEQHS
jgi:hypothetical protein